VRVDSSPDNDGTGRYCQTARVRQASPEGVREKPAFESLSIESTGSNLADVGQAAVLHPMMWSENSLGRLMSPVGRPR
jgi:hypothetical protein